MNEQVQDLPIWSLAVRLLHWLTVAALAIQVFVAFWLMGGPGMATMRWLPVHMSLGAGIVGITLARIAWRIGEGAPARLESRLLRQLGHAVHAGLYGLLLAVSATGWLAYRPAPLMPAVRLFGAWPVPAFRGFLGFSSRDFATIHRGLVWVFLGVAALHIAAALWHALVLRDGVWKSMFGRRIVDGGTAPETR
ncbi:MAG: cytochrome b/b6 domain-containing protein [Rhizobiales bacterium]|nr:cytochrome b/b6 domain-containing protein [Hyphomicrobiales bacterium]